MTDIWPTAGLTVGHAAAAGGAVLLLGWLLVRLTRSVARRRVAGGWAVRGAVLAAALTLFPAWLPVPLPTWPATAPPPADPTPVPTFEPDEWELVEVEDAADDAVPEPPVIAAEKTETPAAGPSLLPLVLLPYAAVALAGVGQLLLGQWALARLRRSAGPAPPRVQTVFDRLAVDVRPVPTVLVSDRVESPVCFGLTRPTVLLPRTLARQATAEELTWVLAHELDHLRRGDPRTAVWLAAARALFFFLPWFWIVRRSVRLAEEQLADAAATDAGGRPADYAAFLVSLSSPGHRRRGRHPLGATGVSAGHSDLFRRVQMLLNERAGDERTAPRGWTLAVGGAVLTAAVGLAGLKATADDKPKPPAPPEPPTEVVIAARIVAEGDDTAAIKKELEAAAKAGDVDQVRKLADKLEKAAGAKKLTVLAAPPGADTVKGVRVWQPGFEVEAYRQALEGLKQAAAGMKSNSEAKKAIDMAIEETTKQLAAAQKEPKAVEKRNVTRVAPVPPVPPVAPLPPMAPLPLDEKTFKMAFAGGKEAVEAMKKNLGKTMESYKKQIEELKGKPEAQAAVKEAMNAYQKAIQAAIEGMDKAPKVEWKMAEELRFPGGEGQPMRVRVAGVGEKGRLGVQLEPIPEVLLSQLDVKPGVGVLIAQVLPETPAAKVGLKSNDILLKIADQPIPSDTEAVGKIVRELKAGEAQDVLILRKGKTVTLKGLTLPEAAKPKTIRIEGKIDGDDVKPRVLRVEKAEKAEKVEKAEGDDPKPKTVRVRRVEGTDNKADGPTFSMMNVNVTNSEFRIKAVSGETTYTLDGKLEDGKPVPSAIIVASGDGKKSYPSLEKVPEAHRAAVKSLLGNVRGG